MGLCTKKDCPDGSTMYRVADLEQATELINPVRVSAFLNSLAPHQGRGPCAMADWHESFTVDPGTGKSARSFWNPRTGQKTAEVPDSYVPLNFNAAVLTPHNKMVQSPAAMMRTGPLPTIRPRDLPRL
eukprot:scaffold284390_cov41-Prasinocladus_malaysianus.AAC.1